MAMEINGNLPDYAVRKQNYGSYAAQGMVGNSAAGSTKKKETEKTQETAESSKSKKTEGYGSELAKLVPSVDFKVGNVCSSANSGKSLTVNPQLLEKMRNDPEKEKDMKDMIKGVESMSRLAEGMAKATGWTIVYQHSYIDENGKYHCRMQTRNDGMLKMSAKMREERKKISEKLFEKTKEKAAERKEKLEEALEEKKAAEAEERTIYLKDTDFRAIIEAIQEEDAGKTIVKDQLQVGANLDLKI